MSIIGMTTSPEAFLAREAEMCYAVMAHVTDYDVWHEAEEAVTVDRVIRTLNQNVEIAQNALRDVVANLAGQPRTCNCPNSLADAFITDHRKVPDDTIGHLGLIVNKYFDR